MQWFACQSSMHNQRQGGIGGGPQKIGRQKPRYDRMAMIGKHLESGPKQAWEGQ
jgi:hypothetical protein